MLSIDSIKTISHEKKFRPKLVVFGVGGAGGNALNNMIRSNLEGVTFVAVNTDAQALEYSLAENRIQIGKNITGGLGAGAMPEIGRKAVEEEADEITTFLDGANMLFITAGMGGGTGTGAAPAIAAMAKERGILTVAVITKPFDFEGKSRQKIADSGIAELKKYVDTLIVIPNQNLFRTVNEATSLTDAFKIADRVLHDGIKSITDLIIMPGLINLDFADVRTVMKDMGRAMMSSGESSDENRAMKAAELAIVNPLLDIASIDGAKGILINITGGVDMTLFEVNDAVEKIRSNLDENSRIIFGAILDEKYNGSIRVSVVATGIEAEDDSYPTIINKQKPKVSNISESQGENLFTLAQDNFNQTKRDYITSSSNPANKPQVSQAQIEEESEEIDEKYENTPSKSASFYQSDKDFDVNNEELSNEEDRSIVQDDNVEDLGDEYFLGSINEPSRITLQNKIKKQHGIPVNKQNHIEDNQDEEEDDDLPRSRKGAFSRVVNNILFGAEPGEKVKKKVNDKRDILIMDIFEDDIISSNDSYLNMSHSRRS